MLFSDLLEQLALGELSQHSIGSDGYISEEHYDKIIVQLNHGLTTLHTRFPLKTNELLLQQYEGVSEYKLSKEHAVSYEGVSLTDRWIIDSVFDPFLDDVLRIEQIWDEGGCQIPINDDNDTYSWFTVTPTTIQIPAPEPENMASVIYRANHPKIELGTKDLDTEIDIPQNLVECLCAFIASRIYTSMGNQASAQLSAFYRARYQELLLEADRFNTFLSSDMDSNIGICRGGWL